MLMKADIMLLDEPTNHLDVKNVAWLEDYLTHLPDVTSMVVSHDSGFLDHVCTGIIHYENRKLKHYRVSICVHCSVISNLNHEIRKLKHYRVSAWGDCSTVCSVHCEKCKLEHFSVSACVYAQLGRYDKASSF